MLPECHRSSLALPLIKRLIPRSIRLRFKTHHGTPSQVLTELSGFCLPVDRVPVDMGGMLAVNAPEWVMKRQVLETLRQHSASTVARGLAQHQRDNPQQLPPISDATTAILSAAIAQVQGPASLGQSHQPTLLSRNRLLFRSHSRNNIQISLPTPMVLVPMV